MYELKNKDNDEFEFTLKEPVTGNIYDISSKLKEMADELEYSERDKSFKENGFVSFSVDDEDDSDITIHFTVPYEWAKKTLSDMGYSFVSKYIKWRDYHNELFQKAKEQGVIIFESYAGK